MRKLDKSVEEAQRGLESAERRVERERARLETPQEKRLARRRAMIPPSMVCPGCSRKVVELHRWCAPRGVCISCNRSRGLRTQPQLLVVHERAVIHAGGATILRMKRALRLTWDGVALIMGVSNAQARKVAQMHVLPRRWAERLHEYHVRVEVPLYSLTNARAARGSVGLKRLARELRWTWQRLDAIEKGTRNPTAQEIQQLKRALLKFDQTT